MIYFFTAIGLTPGGSSTVHIYTQTIHRTTQLTNWEECGPCPIFVSYTLAFALQLRKKHRKTSIRVAEECQLARWKQNIQNTAYITIRIHKQQSEYITYRIKQNYTKHTTISTMIQKRTWRNMINEKAIKAANYMWSIHLLITLDTLLLRFSLHFTTLSFGLNPFKFPTTPCHLTSLQFTSLHFTALLDDFPHTSISFISSHL